LHESESMLIRIFKQNAPVIPLLLLLAGLLLWTDGFLMATGTGLATEGLAPLYRLLVMAFENTPLLSVMVAFVLLMLQVFLINYMVQANNLLGKPSWLPGFLYLLLMSSDPSLISMHPVLVANLFLIWALARTLTAYSEGDVMAEVFNVGFLIALAGLFYYPAIVFFLWLLVVLGVYFLLSFRGLAAALMGFLTPFFFLVTWYYLSDQLDLKIGQMTTRFDPFLLFEQPYESFAVIMMLALALISILSFVKINVGYVADKPIRIRKRIRVLVYFFVVALASILLATRFDVHHGLLMPPLAIAWSVLLLETKRKWMADLMLYLFLALVIAGKVFF